MKMTAEVRVLDAGFSTQLSTYVGDRIDGDPLWTARFLATDPQSIFATHLDFLRAGSDIIETNTYQASIDGFVEHLGLTETESLDLIYQAVNHAKKAVAEYKKLIKADEELWVSNREPLIAGSCGPYGAALHDGSEYTGDYRKEVSSGLIKEWHRPRLEALVKSGVDLLAFETIPCKHEAEALLELLREFPNTKAWLSFSCRDDGKSIAEGLDFQDVATSCYSKAPLGQLMAVGVNCIAPQYVTPILSGINQSSNKQRIPLVAYPNSGEVYTVTEGWQTKNKRYPIETFIPEWFNLGVTYVGGCCRTYALDIERIRNEVDHWKRESCL